MAGKSRKKTVYPEKRRMNLYFKEDRTTVPATIALYVLFAAVLCLAFFKFFIYDMLQETRDAQEQLAYVQAQEKSYEEKLAGYDDILRRYQMYSATADEEAQTDRMDILALLDDVIRPVARIESVDVSGGSVSVRFSGVTLREAAGLVRRLEQSPIVYDTAVDTAATVEDSRGNVTASIEILLEKESGEERAADETKTEGQ